MNQAEQNLTPIPAQYYITDPEQHDEIDLFELVASIVKQWKLILLISFVGTLIGVLYAYNLPKHYENFTQIRPPLPSDLKIINLNGYSINANTLFDRIHDNLKSPEVFKQYLIKSNSITEFYSDLKITEDTNLAILGLTSNLEVNYVDDDSKKTKEGAKSGNIQIKLKSSNQEVAIKTLNQYLLSTEQTILSQVRERGKYAINLRTQEIQLEITKLRSLAKQKRLNTIADLTETLKVAKIMGVTDAVLSAPTNTPNPNANPKSKTLNLFVNQANQFQKYMLGSDYLTAEINRLESRGNVETADDAFIPTMPALQSELVFLKKKSFNFEGAKLYTLDKLAAENDAPVKPNKRLIAIIAMLLSGILALFVALIVSTVQKRKLSEEKTGK